MRPSHPQQPLTGVYLRCTSSLNPAKSFSFTIDKRTRNERQKNILINGIKKELANGKHLQVIKLLEKLEILSANDFSVYFLLGKYIIFQKILKSQLNTFQKFT